MVAQVREDDLAAAAQAGTAWSPSAAWFALAVLVGVITFGILDRQVVNLMMAPIATSLNLTMTQVGLVHGFGAAVFSLVAMYPLSWLGDRYGRGPVLFACVAIWGAGTAACGLAMSYDHFFAAAVAISAAESGLGPLTASLVPELFPAEKRATANAVLVGGPMIGGSLCMLLLGGLSAQMDSLRGLFPASMHDLEPWRLMFFLAAAPTPLFMLLLGFAKLGRRRQQSVSTPEAPRDTALLPYLKANGIALAAITLALVVCSIGSDAGHGWIAIGLTRLFNVTPATNGVGLGIAMAVGAAATIPATKMITAWLRKRHGALTPVRSLSVAMIVLVVPALAMVCITAPWQAFALEAFQIMLGGVLAALSYHIMQDLAPAALRSQVFAITHIVTKPLAGLGVTSVGFLSDQFGDAPRGVFFGAAIVAVTGLLAGPLLLKLTEKMYLRLRNQYA